MTTPITPLDPTVVITWAVEQHALQAGTGASAAVLLDRWFADAAARWPRAWRAARRSPRTMLWLASRSAALASFDDVARARYGEHCVRRLQASEHAEPVAQLLAIGDVLRALVAAGDDAADPLPEPLDSRAVWRGRLAA